MQVSSTELRTALGESFPNAVFCVLDRRYAILKSNELHKSRKKFKRYMGRLGISKWIPNKFDCDKWAWFFKAFHILLGLRRSKTKYAPAVGMLFYKINADPFSGHAVNFGYSDTGIQVIDLTPGAELKPLTEKEKASVWMIII